MMKKLMSLAVAALLMFGVCTAVSATTVDAFDDWAAELTTDGTYAVSSCLLDQADITVPDALGGTSVTGVAPHTFLKNTSMQTLTIPEGVTSIGAYACLKCSALTTVALPQSLTTLGEAAFSGDTALAGINLEDTSLVSIEAYAFANTALTDVALPATCTSISDNAFSGCGSLLTLTIPHGVTEIGENAFSGCDQLTILCKKDSYAAAYAEEHGIPYESVTIIYPFIKGDADGDGVVSIMDATHIQRCLARFEIEEPEAVLLRGDVDGGGLSIIDATAIQRVLVNMGNPYGVGETVYR